MSEFPLCPRQVMLEQLAAAASDPNTPPPPEYLTASGTDDPNKFANPVYLPESQCIVAWVAPVLENRIRFRRDGSVATGTILDRANFDTRYITCRQLPAAPLETWPEMYSRGTYAEWDHLLVTLFPEHQEAVNEFQNVLAEPPIQISGLARKVNFHFEFSLASPHTDRLHNGL